MGSYPDEFPFGIMEVVNLLNLRIRRQQANSVYVDCPFCGDRRGRMNVNFVKNVWRCNHCDAHGGMLALYAELNHTTTSDAYWEIAEALCDNIQEEHARSGNEAQQRPASPCPSTSGAWAAPAGHSSSERKTVPQSNKASPAEIHQTLSLLLAQLTLRPAHREHLRSPKRGLSDEQIDALGFKSTPPPFLCRSITERLIKQGCKVQGVPGFYQDGGGHWTMAFCQKTAGILIPAIGFDGMLQGFQIKLDIPLKNKDDPPEKPGAKYIWFSSSSKKNGTGSGSPVHLVGNPSARVVYVIEGLLKADISYCLTGRTFAAIAGANNTSPLDAIIKEGRMLHHCVGNDGAGERYYDRIERRESFIMFLRRAEEPEDPYYTLEIEPDGTVRQKRTLFDRQHEDIEQATEFLQKWQKVIAARLTGQDLKLAAQSRVLRNEEFIQMKKDRVVIHTGHLAGHLLADVLLADLMENKEIVQQQELPAAA